MIRRVLGVVAPLVVLLVGVVVSSSVMAGTSVADDGFPTIDGQFSGTGPVVGGSVVDLRVTGRGGVPAAGVGAVVVNVAVTNATSASFLSVFPAGSPRPTAANLNFAAGQTVPNLVVVKVGADGRISLFNFAGTVDVVVDVQGWFPVGSSFIGLNPARLLDTRPDHPTIDGLSRGMGPIGGLDVEVAGRGGIPAAAGVVGSVVVNVAVTNPTAASFLTVWPAGQPRPTAANLNYVAGQTVANLVVVKVNEYGTFSLFNYAGRADVVVDVLGWFPREASFEGMVPARLMDTRAGYPTIDQSFAGIGGVGPSETRSVTVVGRAGVPVGAGAVALNVAVTNPTASSFLTVWPAGESRPTAANLNFTRGQTVPNMVIVKVGAGGQISLFNLFGTTDVVVDILGWFPDNGSYVGLTPVRLIDSRGSTPVAVRTPVAVCVALRTISEFDRRSNRIIWNGRDFAEVPAMLRQAIPIVLGAYDDLAAAVPDLSVEARTLSDFTQAAASAAAGTATISELVSKILELPNLYEASAAGVALTAYAERNCGFSTGPQA